MTDKPVQARSKIKKPSKNKSAIRIPISLHFFAVEIVVIILAVFIVNIYIQSIVKDYIYKECDDRLTAAVESTKSLTQTFRLELDASEEKTEQNIRQYLLNSIATSDTLSSQATIALYTFDETTGKFYVLWPNYSVSYANRAYKIIHQVIDEKGYETLNKTQELNFDGNLLYYRTIGFKLAEPDPNDPNANDPSQRDDAEIDLSNYYLCVYVNSNNYYSFMAQNSLALIQAALLAIVIAGIFSIMMTYPIIFSTQKLSRFARRVAKGDFTPVKGHIVSKELSELGDVMNHMAYRL